MVHRSRADWPVVVAAFALLVCAIGLLATGALYGDTVALGGLRQAILAAPPIDRAVVVRTAATADELPAVDAAIRDELATALASSGGEVALVAGSGSLVPVGLDTETARQHLTQLASFEDIERHASLTSGRWGGAGKDPLEATLSEGAAAALGLGIGDRVRLTRGLASSDVVEARGRRTVAAGPRRRLLARRSARPRWRPPGRGADHPWPVRRRAGRPPGQRRDPSARPRMAGTPRHRRARGRRDRRAPTGDRGRQAGASDGAPTAARGVGGHEPAGDPGRCRPVDPRQPERRDPADDPVRRARGLRRPAGRRPAPRSTPIRDGAAAIARRHLGTPRGICLRRGADAGRPGGDRRPLPGGRRGAPARRAGSARCERGDRLGRDHPVDRDRVGRRRRPVHRRADPAIAHRRGQPGRHPGGARPAGRTDDGPAARDRPGPRRARDRGALAAPAVRGAPHPERPRRARGRSPPRGRTGDRPAGRRRARDPDRAPAGRGRRADPRPAVGCRPTARRPSGGPPTAALHALRAAPRPGRGPRHVCGRERRDVGAVAGRPGRLPGGRRRPGGRCPTIRTCPAGPSARPIGRSRA